MITVDVIHHNNILLNVLNQVGIHWIIKIVLNVKEIYKPLVACVSTSIELLVELALLAIVHFALLEPKINN